MGRYDKANIKIPKELYYRIENDVVNLYLELQLEVPINPEDIAERLGYVIRKMSQITDKDAQKFLRFDSKGYRRDGYSFYDPQISGFVILINDIDSLLFEHDDFTIMHEIAHIRLKHKEESDLANMLANYYAGYALVPSPLYSMLGCKNTADIVNKFEVSSKCATICYKRCKNWEKYSSFSKTYEHKLKNYYKNIF